MDGGKGAGGHACLDLLQRDVGIHQLLDVDVGGSEGHWSGETAHSVPVGMRYVYICRRTVPMATALDADQDQPIVCQLPEFFTDR